MPRVLIVDDDPLLRRICVQALEGAGYTVSEAADGEEAVKRYRECHCDVILMDIIMPHKDGVEAILELRELDPRVRIVAMSGGGAIPAGKYLAITEHLGVQGMLRKPFTPEALLSAVQQAAAHHPQR